jgi:hypothetical protein
MRNGRAGVLAPRAGPERRLNSGSSAASQPPHAISAGCRSANASIARSSAGARGSLTIFAAASSCEAAPMRSKSTRSRPKDATVGVPAPAVFNKAGLTVLRLTGNIQAVIPMTTPATAKPTAAGRMRLRGVTLMLIEVYICGQPGRKSRLRFIPNHGSAISSL